MDANRERLRERLLATFQGEAEEHLAEIVANLRRLAEDGIGGAAQHCLEATFRAMHTLKGAARSVSLAEVEALCSACESSLSAMTRGRRAPDRRLIARLQEGAQGIARLIGDGPRSVEWRELIAQLEAAPDTPPAPPPDRSSAAEDHVEIGTSHRPAPVESIRIETAQLDRLIVQSEELLVPKLAAAERVGDIRALLPALARCHARLKELTGERSGAADGKLAEAVSALRESEQLARRTLVALQRDRAVLDGTVENLIAAMQRVRMTAAASILEMLPDMVADLARASGKEISCTILHDDLQLDRKVLQAIKDPLIHLVRNAVDHGIETPATRRALDKPPTGSITIAVNAREGARIEILVADDGSGIDLAAVREAAVRRRIADRDTIEQLTPEQALDLIFRPTLSTRSVATSLSGHGFGLAIVAEHVEQIGGTIAVDSRSGEGTRFRLNVPAAIATFRGLLVRSGERLFLLPLDAVEAVIANDRATAGTAAGRDVVAFRDQPLPCGSLARVLELGEDAADGPGAAVVVIAVGERSAGFRVVEVLGHREVLLKPLQPPLLRVRNIAAAGLLATGELALVLRPADLIASLQHAISGPQAPAARPERRRRRTILIVDDSITTRTMERNLFEALGYRVRVAADGIDAWSLLASEDFDVVVSDVDMPRMNGFELTERIRQDRRLAELPVVLVTALDAREDREKGVRVGANAYVIKANLENTNLQEIIERLV